MKRNTRDLIDFEKVDKLLEGFNKSTGFVAAMIDLDGNVLSKSGERQICTEFHRKNPETLKNCIFSDTVLASKIATNKKYHYYECLNGLTYVTVPIVINGEHIANLCSGQLFFKKPDRNFFLKQAVSNRFNQKKYFIALDDVPVVSKEKVLVETDFLLVIAQFISDMAYQKLEQLQLNEALIRSEEKYRLISDNSDEWIYWVEPDGSMHYVSPACKHITGYFPEEFCNDPELINKIIFDKDKQLFDQHTKLSEPDKTPHRFDFRIVTKSGDVKWISHNCSPLFNNDGKYLGRRATNRNITESKLNKEKLYESVFKFDYLYEKGPFGMAMSAKDFRFIKANPAFCNIFGYSESELLGFSFKEITHPDDLAGDMTNIRKLINKEISVYKTEKRYIRKDGQIIWGSLTLTNVFDSNSNFLYYLGVIEDITRRKEAEENLAKSKKLHTETEEIGKVGGWEFNVDTMITNWTDEVYRIHEVDFEFKHNVKIGLDFYTPESRPIIENAVQRVIEFGEPFDLELEIITTKGNLRKVHTIGKADLKNNRVYGFFQDITERKNKENLLQKLEYILSEGQKIAHMGTFEYLAESHTTNWSEEEYLIYGLDPGGPSPTYEVMLKKCIHPEDAALLHQTFSGALQSRSIYELEHRILRPDGSVRWVYDRAHPYFDKNGKLIRYVGTTLDITDRKQNEENLQRSELRFRNIFEQANDGIFIVKDDNHFLDVNDKGLEQTGYTKDELLKMSVADMMYSNEFARIKDEKLKIFSGLSHLAEYIIVRKNGTTFYGEASSRRLNDNSNLLIVRDLTERRQSEEKIRELSERISTAARASQVGIWDWDIKNNILTWDDQLYILYGLKKEEFSGAYEAWVKGLYPDDKKFCEEETRLALEGEKEFNIEFRILWPDGTIRYSRSRGEVFRNKNGEPVRMVGINYDITEQKIMAEKIREKDMQFRKLSANIPDLIFQFTKKPDGNYCIPLASESIRNIFGCSPEDVVDDFGPIARVILPQDLKRVIRDIEYSAEHLTYFTCEFRVQIPGHHIQWIFSRATPEKLQDGSVTWFGFVADITYRKKAEEAIQKLNIELEQKVIVRTSQLESANKELEAFSYSVSHDLRAPLRHINGYVDLLNKKFRNELSEKAQYYLKNISDSTNQMGSLINDLLHFSRTNRQELNKVNVDMYVLVNEIIEKMKPDLKNRKINWKIQKLPFVVCDISMIRQVWFNLVDNAIKYTSNNKSSEITIGFEEHKENIEFYIKDNGVGFDMKYAHKLFGVFQRLHSQSEFKGTGIGLANVKRIIHKHSGTVWTNAKLGKGATFFFTLPKIKHNNND